MAAKQELLPISEDWHKALAIVAHPDDLEYGAASAIARWTSQGKDIQYLLVTEGEAGIDSMDPKDVGPLRRNEEIASAQVVGVTDVQFLDYKDGVVEYGLPLRRDLTKIIRSKKPDVIITINHELQFAQGQLNMADHRYVALAAFDAARDAGNRWIFQELIDDLHKQFVTVVSLERRLSFSKAQELADGKVFSGQQAFDNGLIDVLVKF